MIQEIAGRPVRTTPASSPRVILYSGWYSLELVRHHKDKIFVFGDNLRRFGKGGQAIIRDELNTFGVATKRKPSNAFGSFFGDGGGYQSDLDCVLDDLGGVWELLKIGQTIVIPVRDSDKKVSLGLERVELPQRVPEIYATIEQHVQEMCENYEHYLLDKLD